jgi:hypothetical protein
MKKNNFLVLLLFYYTYANCQMQAAKWYFGNYAAIDFLSTPPSVLNNSVMRSLGGFNLGSSISDDAGMLLIYSKEDTIFNRTHQVMQNGTGINGVYQLPIRSPGNTDQYYFFTLPYITNQQNMSLKYSIIDMSLAAGNGSVIVKNIVLSGDSCLGLTAVKHCNGRDIWVVTHKKNSTEFRSYLLTPSGISTTFVPSYLGTPYQHAFKITSNPAGNRLCGVIGDPMVSTAVNPKINSIILYDFNRTTGAISNPQIVKDSLGGVHCEFSPDGSKLYATIVDYVPNFTDNFVLQWDLCAGSLPAIVNSEYTVQVAPYFEKYGLQKGMDGKIYITRVNSSYLAVINNPNASGSLCNFVNNGLSLGSGTCQASLPSYLNSVFAVPAISVINSQTLSCLSASFSSAPVPSTLCGSPGYSLTGSYWLFGDPASGTSNSTTVNNPTHVFSGPGTYTIKQVFSNNLCTADTSVRVIKINGPAPTVSVVSNATICNGNTISITAGGADTFTWNAPGLSVTGNSITITPTITTTFSVTGNDTVSGCAEMKTVKVTVSKCVDISEQNLENADITVSPNPSTGMFEIFAGKNGIATVYNTIGAKILTIQLVKGKTILDLQAYENGCYMLRSGSLIVKLIKH